MSIIAIFLGQLIGITVSLGIFYLAVAIDDKKSSKASSSKK